MTAANAANAVSASAELDFGRFVVQPAARRLLVDGLPAAPGARAFDVLMALIERRERVVSKNELFELVWPGRVVEENNLQVHVSALRKLLGPQTIATIPGRGYRFTAVIADATAAVPAPAPAPALPLPLPLGAPQPLANLLAWAAPLIGREGELAALAALFEQQRLVTIVGAGGVGKTRLAQALWLQQQTACAQGAAWVELAAIGDPAHVVSSASAALGLGAGAGAGAGDALAAMVQALRPLQVLITLDNAEHLVDEVARVAQALLQGCPQARILVTSQLPLKVPGEHVYRLDGLAVPAATVTADAAGGHGAVALFVARAAAAGRYFRLDRHNVAAAVQICRQLDGVPLAIELAAARLPLLGITRLAAALDERLQLLTGGSRIAHDRPARQRTLRAALEWSHGLLREPEQTVFRRLGVFSGGFTLDMAQRVVSHTADAAALDRWAVLDALGELVDHSLVSVGTQEPPRYTLLESPRALALEALAHAGETPAWRARHAQAYADYFAARDADLLEGRIGIDALLEQLAPDIDNGRDAMAWALAHAPQVAVTLAPGLLRVLTTARLPERTAIIDATEALLEPAMPAALRAAWYQAAGMLAPAALERRLTRMRSAVALHRELGHADALYLSIVALLSMAEHFDAAERERLGTELRAIEPDCKLPPRSRFLACQADYFYHYARAEWAAAETALLGQIEWARRAGHSDGADTALSNLASLAQNTGDLDMAVKRGRELVQQRSGGRRRHNLELARSNLALALLMTGGVAEARELALLGAPGAAAYLLVGHWADALAHLAALEQRPRCAARLCGFADAAYGAADDSRVSESSAARAGAEQLARAALGDTAFERLRRDGEALDADTAWGLGLDTRES